MIEHHRWKLFENQINLFMKFYERKSSVLIHKRLIVIDNVTKLNLSFVPFDFQLTNTLRRSLTIMKKFWFGFLNEEIELRRFKKPFTFVFSWDSAIKANAEHDNNKNRIIIYVLFRLARRVVDKKSNRWVDEPHRITINRCVDEYFFLWRWFCWFNITKSIRAEAN